MEDMNKVVRRDQMRRNGGKLEKMKCVLQRQGRKKEEREGNKQETRNMNKDKGEVGRQAERQAAGRHRQMDGGADRE